MFHYFNKKIWKLKERIKCIRWTLAGGLLLMAILAMAHLYLVSKTFVIDDAGSIHSTFEGYGDIPLHLTQISKFAYENSFDLNEPIFFGEKIHYPFLINFISGLLLRLTGWFTFSVMFPIYLLVIANLILLAAIYNKLFKNLFLTAVAVWLFMLGSGVGGLTYLAKSIMEHQPISQISSEIIRGKIPSTIYLSAKYPAQNIDFGAPIALAFIHQRTFFLGFFGFLLFLYLLIKLESRPNLKWKKIFSAGLVYGLLPMIHTHSFVAASIVLVAYGIILAIKKQWLNLKKLCILMVTGFILAIPQVWYLIGTKDIFVSTGSFVKFRLGWMINSAIGSVQFPSGDIPSVVSFAYLYFLSLNFGFILFIFFLGTAYFIFRSKKLQDNNILPILFFLSAVLIFSIVQIIQFQPWDFDNNKLLVYYQLFAAPFTLWLIIFLFGKYKKVTIGIIIGYFFVATFSGFIDLTSRLREKKSDLSIIFDISAEHLATFVRSNLKNELILTSTNHLNPVASLAGKGVLVGYPGWLWTRGIDYFEREKEIRIFYANPLKKDGLLQKYRIRYVLLDNMTKNEYGAKKEVFDQLFDKIFEDGQYILYKVNKNY